MGCDAGLTLNRYRVGLNCVYQEHRIDAYTDLSAMMVEGICLHVEDMFFSLVLSIILSWAFRILAHGENQYSYVYTILGQFLVPKQTFASFVLKII